VPNHWAGSPDLDLDARAIQIEAIRRKRKIRHRHRAAAAGAGDATDPEQRPGARRTGHTPAGGGGDIERSPTMTEAHRIARAGSLIEATLLGALQQGMRGWRWRCRQLPVAAVERAMALRNAKALVSLTWKAGFSMTTAIRLQGTLTRVGPAEVLAARPRGGVPLAVEVMHWQLDILRGGRP